MIAGRAPLPPHQRPTAAPPAAAATTLWPHAVPVVHPNGTQRPPAPTARDTHPHLRVPAVPPGRTHHLHRLSHHPRSP